MLPRLKSRRPISLKLRMILPTALSRIAVTTMVSIATQTLAVVAAGISLVVVVVGYGRGDGRGSWGRYSNVQCQVCHKFGLEASFCYHRVEENYVPTQPLVPPAPIMSPLWYSSNWSSPSNFQ